METYMMGVMEGFFKRLSGWVDPSKWKVGTVDVGEFQAEVTVDSKKFFCVCVYII
jgi:hypothetical protein